MYLPARACLANAGNPFGPVPAVVEPSLNKRMREARLLRQIHIPSPSIREEYKDGSSARQPIFPRPRSRLSVPGPFTFRLRPADGLEGALGTVRIGRLVCTNVSQSLSFGEGEARRAVAPARPGASERSVVVSCHCDSPVSQQGINRARHEHWTWCRRIMAPTATPARRSRLCRYP